MAEGTGAPRPNGRKTEIGKVVSDRMEKTLTVLVERRVAHPVFGKFIRQRTSLKAHDEKKEAREGDLVEIQETRPLSKTKRWRLIRVVRRAAHPA
ncbi:MAG: 30S ribosomal protein S17 [Planctomycetes bacterium]|jgi:small subunit ribosomal protein S17|nr:30S ribosomal protein S17 [Planctomycetota bacterium]